MRTAGVWLVCILLCLSACGPMYEYRHLDGLWQMRHIEYANGDAAEQPTNTYYSFQMHIINIRKLGRGEYYGSFKYVDDSMHVHMKDAPAGEMKAYGMNDTVQHFLVEKLTSDKLILKSDYARLEFRKY